MTVAAVAGGAIVGTVVTLVGVAEVLVCEVGSAGDGLVVADVAVPDGSEDCELAEVGADDETVGLEACLPLPPPQAARITLPHRTEPMMTSRFTRGDTDDPWGGGASRVVNVP